MYLLSQLLTSKSGLNNSNLDNCMYRLNRLEMVVPRPFLLEVLKLNQDGKIPTSDVAEIFTVVENYFLKQLSARSFIQIRGKGYVECIDY